MEGAALWAVRVDRALTEEECAALLPALPPERRERLSRVRRPERRWEPLCAWGLLRLALRERLGWRDLPPLAYTDRGKPWFPNYPTVCFSLSHTAGAVLVGMSEGAIGVDLEQIRPVGPRLLERLGERELGPLLAAWVRREARFKCGTVPTLLGPEPPLEPEERYAPVETFPDYVAGTAVLGGPLPGAPRLLSLEELLELGIRS